MTYINYEVLTIFRILKHLMRKLFREMFSLQPTKWKNRWAERNCLLERCLGQGKKKAVLCKLFNECTSFATKLYHDINLRPLCYWQYRDIIIILFAHTNRLRGGEGVQSFFWTCNCLNSLCCKIFTQNHSMNYFFKMFLT